MPYHFGRGDPSPTAGERCLTVGVGALDDPRFVLARLREVALKASP